MFKLMTDFFFINERTFLLHLAASGHRHKIVLSVNKLYMSRLCFQGNFRFCLFLLNEYDKYKDTKFLRLQLKALILIS